MSWSDGYFTELEYTHGYYKELCPEVLRLACLAAGIAPPRREGLTYLELGYGQGLSLNIHAAATEGHFWGTDFNPTQSAHARALAEASGAKVQLLNDSFEQLAARKDLPQFDIIALHGIWSWISDRNRSFIVDILHRHLRVGGLVYISYNCLPGWAPATPVRHLMALHSEFAGGIGGAAGTIDAALAFTQRVADAGAFYFQANPTIAGHVKQINGMSRNYLAHEYFNRDWSIMNFSDVAAQLENAKLSFVAPATLLDHLDDYSLTPEWQKLLTDIKHPILRESVRDYLTNQRFRRDIFVKGARRLSGLELREYWLAQQFILTAPTSAISLTVQGSIGEVTLHEHIYKPVLEALADANHSPKQLADLAAHPKLKTFELGQLVGALLVLAGLGHVRPVQPGSPPVERCRALNRSLCRRSLVDGEISDLASPVIGGGIRVARELQLILLAMLDGHETPIEQARHLNSIFEGAGEKLIKNGTPLQPGTETINEFKGLAETMAGEIAMLRSLGVI